MAFASGGTGAAFRYPDHIGRVEIVELRIDAASKLRDVTLSDLNGTFLNSILERVDEKIAQRNSQSSGQAGGTAADTFTVVTLSNGQTLTGSIGCEVMLRVGTAVCVSPSNPGLIDESAAVTLNNSGALATNHLYMMTIEGRGVKATSGTVKLLVRGGYTIA